MAEIYVPWAGDIAEEFKDFSRHAFTLPSNVARNLFFSKAYAVVEVLLSLPAAAAGVAWVFLGFGPGLAFAEDLASGLALALAASFTFVGFCDATRSLCR